MQRQAFTVIVLIVILFIAGVLFTRSREESEQVNDTAQPVVSDTTVGVHLFTPTENAVVGSPLHLAGDALGSWYAEASFPINVYDASGALLAEGRAEATTDWMTDKLVPFTATLVFTASTTADTGTIVLSNDNPSGDLAKAESLTVPVRFGSAK